MPYLCRSTDLIREGYVAGELRRWRVYNGSRRGPAKPTGCLTLIDPAGKQPAISPLPHRSLRRSTMCRLYTLVDS
jgi:hypothetical protein